MSTTQPNNLVLFKKGAVLRHGELNDVVSFFDQAQKFSNLYLDGTGIVSGLEVKLENGIVTVSPGVAVMPNGQLVRLENPCHLVLSEEITPDEKMKPYFSHLKLLRVRQDTDTGNIQRIAPGDCVLVKLEEQGGSNNASSCFRENDVNEKRTYALVFYIATPKPQDAPAAKPCFQHLCLPTFTGEDIESLSSREVFYQKFIQKIGQGSEELYQSIELFSGCFPGLFCYEKPEDFRKMLLDDKENQIKTSPNYAYDYLRTLASAYNELISLPYFHHNKRRWIPQNYPNVIGLGRIPAHCWGEDDCRHEWQSAIKPVEGKEEAQFYAQRLLELCKAENLNFQASQNLTYTPSRSDEVPLSLRAIPWYANHEKIRNQWNFLATRRSLQGQIPPGEHTFCYNEGCNFVQVSGHIEKSGRLTRTLNQDDLYLNADRSLQTLKKELNLPFQIKLCSFPASQPGGIIQLRNYFLQHPGLQPMGGVPKGGTLLLLVEQGEEGVRVLGDFALPYYDWYQEPPAVNVEKVIAQFIVESPNNFGQGAEDGIECYVFPLKELLTNGPGKELLPLEVNFKSTSENATEFQWSVDGKDIKVGGRSSAFKHKFDFNQRKASFIVSLDASNNNQAPVSISKKIQGIYADFELDKDSLRQWEEVIVSIGETLSFYKNENVIKIRLVLSPRVIETEQELLLSWSNKSLPADQYVWKWFKAGDLTPEDVRETDRRNLDFTTLLQNFTGKEQTYVIELNTIHQSTGIVDQKNILLEISIDNRDQAVQTSTSLETTLRTRHNQYRKAANLASEAHPELVQTRAFISLIGLFNSNDGPEDLLRSFKNAVTQLSFDKREASVPTEAYQVLLENALNFTLDKLFFLFPNGLPVATNKALDTILKGLPEKTGYQLDSTTLGSWNPKALSSPKHKKVRDALIKKFKA
ncbi:hypothetical protein [Haliscomenobacter sp.]|uniref:hypothetical protein n=1 Tax=Haliscomenobacter sp. TaxID=2717303 RepID=UPI003BA93170